MGKSFSDYKGTISVADSFFRNSSEDFPLMQSYDIQAGEGDERLSTVLENLKKQIEALEKAQSTAKPTEVATEEMMNYILSTADASSLGTVYKFTGTSTIYEQGALYIISEAILDGDGVSY